MADRFEGQVLRGPRVSPANARSTAEPTTGVVRHPKEIPATYDIGGAPDFVDAFADQYRAGLLDAPGNSTVEYIAWAQNTGSLAMVDDSSWWISEGTGTIPEGTLVVLNTTPEDDEPLSYDDGANRAIIVDDGNRSIGSISFIVVARGDVDDYDDDGWIDSNDPFAGRAGDNPYLQLYIEAADQDAQAGVVRLTDAQLAQLDGGLSVERGDRIITVTYIISPIKFYWTRNDRYETRFGWNGATQRWEPLKGTAPPNLGTLLFDETYQMSPKVTNLPVNAFLPGDGSDPDAYSMIRLGSDPGAGSTPTGPGDPDGFIGIQVKADDVVDEGFDFSSAPSLTGVMGQTTGKLAFNPAFVTLHAGKTIWYSYKGFDEEADGVVGPLLGSVLNPLFISPIPGPTDAPLLRIGNRRYLSVTLADTDADLGALPIPASGQVQVSLSTGRLRISPEDEAKADPDNTTTFDKYFLGNNIIYDGVALNQIPQPTKAPVALVDETGAEAEAGTTTEFFIPMGETLPDTVAGADIYRGLGRSGIVDAPDETGSLPVDTSLPGSSRPGGDNTGDKNTGRRRSVEDGVGDLIIFSRTGSTETVYTSEYDDDLPSPSYKVRKGRAYVSREATTIAGKYYSRVSLSRADLREWSGNPVYFLQSTFTPATYTTKARLFSKTRDIFRFEGTEVLYFHIDGTDYQWTAPSGQDFYTPTEVAESIDAVITGTGSAYEMNGRVVIGAGDEDTGNVEIGWGLAGVKDLTGAAVLGFLPGWKAVGGITNWLPDGGTAMGMFRSPLNLDRSRSTPDFRDTARYEGEIIQDSIQPTPFQFLDDSPLQDVAGLDESIYFSLSTVIDDGISVTIVQKLLDHYEDIVYRFGENKFDWVERDTASESVEAPVSSLDLQNAGIVPESMLGAPGIGGGLYVAAEGGAAEFQTQDSDYLLPEDGTPGVAVLTEKFGTRVASGARGELTAGSDIFADNSTGTDFTEVEPGYRLKVLSGGEPIEGSYIVEEALTSKSFRVSPTPTATPERVVMWELYDGLTEDVYDPSIVADVNYKQFNHLTDEPFEVRELSPVGLVPANASAQETSRLFAYMEKALASDRPINIRYGLTAATTANTATMVGLTQTELGTLANNSLTLPEVDTQRFSTGSFNVRVGTTSYTHASGLLVGVTTFSADPGGGDGIEYLTAATVIDGVENPKGRLKFGSNVLSDYESSVVYYAQAFQPPADLAALTVEYRPTDGYLNFSQSDMTKFGGTQAYFVERMITEERQDVTINPLLGAFSFKQPITTDSSIEVSYWEADLEGRKVGDQITEFLPVFIQDEEAIRDPNAVTTSVFYFNVDPRRTIDQRITPIVYIGAVMQNYNDTDYFLEYPDHLNGQGRLTFTRVIPDHVTVKVSYAVLEALGGEKAYESSVKPCYRPPFFIKENQDRFGLRGDRTDEFEAGQLLRVGSESFYIKSTKYYPQNDEGTGDVTAVYIFPNTLTEVGSRSPGNDSLTVISDRPLTTVIDPDGSSPVTTNAAAGLMSTIDIAQFPFQPINQGQTEVVFLGDLTEFTVPGHILEVGGDPHTIAQVELSDDGTRTLVTVTSQFKTGYSVEEGTTIKLSYRPIYPPQSAEFLGVGPMVITEPYELILFGETDEDGNELSGRTLVETTEYDIDPDSGNIRLLEPLQEALGPGQTLKLMFTRLRLLEPFWGDGAVSFPRFFASYLYSISPSADNALLGGQLLGTYTYRAPDTFYYRVVPMPAFLVEAAQQAVNDITAREPAGGTITSAGGGQDNWEQGRIGLKSERSALEDQDRAARAFLEFYNNSVIDFEQIKETISGGFIGDRDGKFRFWVGRGRDYPTPGYEDDISGDLTQRNIWSEVFNEAAGSELFYQTTDWIVTPGSQSLSDGDLSGSFPDPDRIDKLIKRQRALVQNDVDDFVMVTLGKPKMTFKLRFPFFFYRVKGRFRSLYQRSGISRIFPGRTRAFFMSFPGIGGNQETEDQTAWDPGYYTYGRVLFGDKKRTHGHTIGQLRNPALGDIDSGVSTAKLYRRRARARIWGYFPNGIPANSFNGGASPAISGPCVVAVPALLRDVPINPVTGFPDESQLISQGWAFTPQNTNAWLPDAVAGDPELIVPGFNVDNEISLGKPDGTTYEAFCNPKTFTGIPALPGFSQDGYLGVYVRDIQYGCVIRFQDDTGAPINDPAKLLVGTSTDIGVPWGDFPIGAHDTIFAGPPLKKTNAPLPDAQTTTNTIALAQGLDDYRAGFDVTVKSDGRIVDKTWPSFYDPSFFGIKEIFGQHPPDPLSYLECNVEFYYDGKNPFEFPALRGETTDDAGDYQIPYIKAANTEMDRFDEAMVGISPLMTLVDDSPPPAWPRNYYVYPDEILGNDGEVILTPGVGWLPTPAALLTGEDAAPIIHGSAEPGIGDVQRHDLLLIQAEGVSKFNTSGGLVEGPMGIQSVGEVLTDASLDSKFEPPRFVTQTTPPPVAGLPTTPSPVRYIFDNAMAFSDGDPAQSGVSPGVVIKEDGVNGVTILDFSSLGGFSLNDGFTAVPPWPGLPTGNLNWLWAADPNNIIRIKLIARLDPVILNGPAGANPLPSTSGGVVALTIEIQGNTVTVTDYQGNSNVTVVGAPGIAFGSRHAGPLPPANCQEIIIPAIGLLPVGGWGPGPGTTLEWYLPHNVTAGPTYTMDYGFEFTFDIDTFVGATAQSDTAWVDEDRLTFHEVYDLRWTQERGTTYQYPGPPPPPPYTTLSLQGELVVYQVTTWHPAIGASMWSFINGGINGFVGFLPIPLTFKTRTPIGTPGNWTAKSGAGDYEAGTIKAMAFEGWGNTEIETTSDVSFSALPSDERFSGGAICGGVGGMASQFNSNIALPYDPLQVDNRVLTPNGPTTGALANIESGDILVVKKNTDSTHWATTKAGTYVIKHVVVPDAVSPGDWEFHTSQDSSLIGPSTMAGTEAGWCPIEFPTVVGFDTTTNNLTVSHTAYARGGTVVGTTRSGFRGSGTVYIIRSVSDLNGAAAVAQRAVILASYTGLSLDGERLVFENLSNFRYSDGVAFAPTSEEAKALIADQPYQVSGMVYLPVNVAGSTYGLPDNNTVGWHDLTNIAVPAGIKSVAGFGFLTFDPAITAGARVTWDGNLAEIINDPTGPAPGVDDMVVVSEVPTPYAFENDELAPVYDYVVHTLDLTNLVGKWLTLNGGANSLACILPGTLMSIHNFGTNTPSHYAQAGIFLEPSVPRSALDLADSYEKVVDASHSLPDPSPPTTDLYRLIGMRDAQFYDGSGVVLNTPEQVEYEVRRIRRWHAIQEQADSNLKPLRFAYEIRRGIITGYSSNDAQRGTVSAVGFTMNWDDTHTPHQPDAWNDGMTYTGSNLGPFNDEDVNINPGDAFRLIDNYGDLVEEVPIESITSAGQVILAPPGLQTSSVTGMRFEIYLRQPPVPHEQSNEQLLDLITDRLVHRTFSDWGAADEKGGYVPDMEAVPTPDWDEAANRLMDDKNAPASGDFAALGIQKGDIVIVDPVGKIPRDQADLPSTQEQGARPIGDDGVATRPASYTQGYPDDRDDNRGYYRVKRVVDTASPPYIEVDPVSTYTGDVNSDVLFGEPGTDAYEYAVYPTVHDSQLRQYFGQAGDEGQMDLRPTYARDPGNGTFSNYTASAHLQWYSIRPFDYKVIRPSGLFSDEAIDLVLSTRERMLSWIEMIRSIIAGFKSGSYFVFQRDEHISDLGNTANPQSGLGVLTNDYITSILGRLDVTPYINNESCLSLLDRRFWIQDWRLDYLTTDPAAPTLKMKRVAAGETPYTAYTDLTTGGVVRPVLPERVDEVLDTRDRFRPIRFVWLAYRTHVTLGTLATIQRYDEELPERLEEQRRLLLLEDSVEGVTDE